MPSDTSSSDENFAANTALPQPPRTNQNVPMNSAASRCSIVGSRMRDSFVGRNAVRRAVTRAGRTSGPVVSESFLDGNHRDVRDRDDDRTSTVTAALDGRFIGHPRSKAVVDRRRSHDVRGEHSGSGRGHHRHERLGRGRHLGDHDHPGHRRAHRGPEECRHSDERHRNGQLRCVSRPYRVEASDEQQPPQRTDGQQWREQAAGHRRRVRQGTGDEPHREDSDDDGENEVLSAEDPLGQVLAAAHRERVHEHREPDDRTDDGRLRQGRDSAYRARRGRGTTTSTRCRRHQDIRSAVRRRRKGATMPEPERRWVRRGSRRGFPGSAESKPTAATHAKSVARTVFTRNDLVTSSRVKSVPPIGALNATARPAPPNAVCIILTSESGSRARRAVSAPIAAPMCTVGPFAAQHEPRSRCSTRHR